MIEVGQRAPDAQMYGSPGEEKPLAELWADGPVLLVFYLFDWSST